MLIRDILLIKIDFMEAIMKRTCEITCKNYTVVPPQSQWKNKVDPDINRLFYVTGGTGEYFEDGVMHKLEVGKLYFMPSYSGIPTYTDDNNRLVHAFANFKLSPPIVSKKGFCLDPSTSPTLKAAVDAFCELSKNEYNVRKQTGPLSPEDEHTLDLLNALTLFLAESAASTCPDYVIKDTAMISALDLIHSSLAGKLTVSDIAKKCYMSTDGFIRKFTRYIGETPYSYIKKLKIRTALMMRAEGATLEEAADACGYSDASAMLHAISSTSKKGNRF